MNQPDIIDTEVHPMAVARIEPSASPANLFGAENAVAVVEKAGAVASALKDVVRKQGLISKISGKEYPRCEAWTLLGTMLGIFPVLQWTRKLDDGWEARVEAKTRDGAIVGAAEAQCLRGEKNWSNRDDFALRSMAQTRATAKALRMPLGFVMTLAGYEATPAEEMAFTQEPPQNARQTAPAASKAPEPTKAKPKPSEAPQMPTEATRKWALGEIEKAGLMELFPEWLEAAGMIMPGENLADWPLMWVPASKAQMETVIAKVKAFSQGLPAEKPFTAHGAEKFVAASEPQSAAEPEIDPSWLIAQGKIEVVNLKEGKSAKGPWSLWGIKIGQDWFNSFSNSIGHAAQAAKKDGREVRLFFTVNEERNQNEAHHIE